MRDIAKTCGLTVLNGGGVVRGIQNWNHMLLPRRVTKHQANHDSAHYFVMKFDSNAKTQEKVRSMLGLDPRMVKFSVVRLGTGLREVATK